MCDRGCKREREGESVRVIVVVREREREREGENVRVIVVIRERELWKEEGERIFVCGWEKKAKRTTYECEEKTKRRGEWKRDIDSGWKRGRERMGVEGRRTKERESVCGERRESYKTESLGRKVIVRERRQRS